MRPARGHASGPGSHGPQRRREAGRRRLAGLVAVTAALLASSAQAAGALTLSPLNGTPDASPHTQISFLGAPPGEIAGVSVVGSSSGRHSGRLAPYVSAPGASFLPAQPFAAGERVSAGALIGPAGHQRRVSTSFTVARSSRYRPDLSGGAAPARPGTVQSFVSAPTLHPPNVSVTVNAAGTGAGDVFITPTHGLGQSGPMILDGLGRLVWYQPLPTGEVAENLQVQSYLGQPVLTWWQGRIPAALGIGFGSDEIYSAAYTPIAVVPAGNGYEADLHDMQITPQGSAFITAYALVGADLSSGGGPRNGTVQDAIVQEIDIRTGLVMFEWHAFGHVALGDSYSPPPASSSQPWDYFHLNSISPDPWGDGDLLISSRNTWTAYEIDQHTGAVLWRIGGKRSSFRMGAGTGTAWQHDARWQPDRTLTVFDNGATPKAHSQSRVIHERIDFAHRTVSLIGRYVHAPGLLSGSQGDDQLLADGNSFVGWGEAPYFSEYSPSGQLLYDAHIPFPGQSYRAYRFPWSATPAAPPAVAVRRSGAGTVTVYASWNGATGVSAWRVLAGVDGAHLSPLATTASSGFETAIPIHRAAGVFAVQALDSAGQVLAGSHAAHA